MLKSLSFPDIFSPYVHSLALITWYQYLEKAGVFISVFHSSSQLTTCRVVFGDNRLLGVWGEMFIPLFANLTFFKLNSFHILSPNK